jgi:hypothetical protein
VENRTSYKIHLKLTINHFSRRDLGTYMCVSTNSLGHADGTVRLYGESTVLHRSGPFSTSLMLTQTSGPLLNHLDSSRDQDTSICHLFSQTLHFSNYQVPSSTSLHFGRDQVPSVPPLKFMWRTRSFGKSPHISVVTSNHSYAFYSP